MSHFAALSDDELAGALATQLETLSTTLTEIMGTIFQANDAVTQLMTAFERNHAFVAAWCDLFDSGAAIAQQQQQQQQQSSRQQSMAE